MILETIELIGNELSIEALQTKVNNGDFNDILFKYNFLIMTTSGLVKVKKNKEIVLNPVVDLSSYSTTNEINVKLDKKVDKINGKGLSTNDYTTTEKNKLASLENYDDTVLSNKLNSVESIAKGANQALSYGNYSTMITAFNALSNDVYNIGQNMYILTLNVPDLWISSVESTSISYTYTTDEAFVNELETNGYVQVGYYRLSALETQKVDLTNYVQNTDYATTLKAGVFKTDEYYGTNVNPNNGTLIATVKSYQAYNNADNYIFISKGTLENVITGKQFVNKTYVDNIVGDIETILTEITVGGGV